MLVQHTSATLGFKEYTTLANALVFASAAIAGLVFEAQGTRLEVAWDEEREGEFAVEENWYTYLARTFEKKPVAYRYLSRLVTSLYSELAMIFAAPSFFLGASLLACLRFRDASMLIAILGLAITMTSGCYFHRQARCTHKVLCATRKEINARIPPTK